jgi:hypothetical protein
MATCRRSGDVSCLDNFIRYCVGPDRSSHTTDDSGQATRILNPISFGVHSQFLMSLFRLAFSSTIRIGRRDRVIIVVVRGGGVAVGASRTCCGSYDAVSARSIDMARTFVSFDDF